METALPFILQNLHRFFLYLAFVPLFFLWVDAASVAPARGPVADRARRVRPALQRPAPDRLLAVVPLAPPPRRRQDGLLLVHPPDAGPLHAVAAAHRGSTSTTWRGRGRASSRSRSPTSTSACSRSGSSSTRRSTSSRRPMTLATAARPKPQVRPHDVLVDRRRRGRPAGRDRGQGGRRGRRARLQVAPRQGPHGDGRGRRRGGARPRRRRRLVAGPLPRHDGRRQAPEQPADGPAPRDGGARRASASSSCGAPSSTGPRTAGSSSDRSAATRTRASPTSATGPASR